jgi:hypothetical protein
MTWLSVTGLVLVLLALIVLAIVKRQQRHQK